MTLDNFNITIKVISDIHLEYRKEQPPEDILNILGINNIKTNKTRVCVLAGDIGWPLTSKYYNFLKEVKEHFDEVIVIAGNHEYYSIQNKQNINIDEINSSIEMICRSLGIHFLDRSTVEINGLIFLGCTLWGKILPEYGEEGLRQSNDLRKLKIRGKLINWTQYNLLHQRDLSWLTQMINKYKDKNKKMIVCTHHCPTPRLNHPDYTSWDKRFSTQSHVTNQEHLMCPNILAWFSGHTHHSTSSVINGTLNMSNCLGHSNQETNYDKEIEIDF